MVTIGTAAGVRTEAFITRMDTPLGRARRQLARDRRVHRRAERHGAGGSDRADRHAGVADGAAWRARPPATTDAETRCATRWRPARRCEKLRADDRVAGRRRRASSTIPAGCRRRRTSHRLDAPRSRATCNRSMRCSSAAPRSRSAPAATRRVMPVDLSAGILLHKKPGDAVSAGEPLMELHYNDESRLERRRSALATQAAVDRRQGARRSAPTRRWAGYTTAARQMFVRLLTCRIAVDHPDVGSNR